MGGQSAANVKFDADGKARVPQIPAGTYYLFGAVQYNKQPLLFDLRIDLKPGPNSAILGESKATPID
jgi:hypothetical protein